ncbi:hypothetical protein B0H65DRAFT_167382 [Neurospora tetraspora]|uniref:Uncharacterized protein n=1 Tax=Neurospora tetraspora TaxID=94610 RepID=A0AAE0JI93_9PEZI|nr:hypothetical protein B0H65DRAFT_167382 [Neurospora tetraspora]
MQVGELFKMLMSLSGSISLLEASMSFLYIPVWSGLVWVRLSTTNYVFPSPSHVEDPFVLSSVGMFDVVTVVAAFSVSALRCRSPLLGT